MGGVLGEWVADWLRGLREERRRRAVARWRAMILAELVAERSELDAFAARVRGSDRGAR
jgi:hypothetical protein